MATVFQMNNLPCKTWLATTQHLQTTSKPSILPLKSIKRIQNSSSITHILTRKPIQSRPGFRVFASEDKEWVWEQEETVTESVIEEDGKVEVERLKKVLVESFYGTARGLKATVETRAEICELITQLQDRNPTPPPTQALPLLHGKWILAYTSFKGLFPLLSSVEFQLLKLEEISQIIDAQALTVQNSIQFSGPLAANSNTSHAKFEIPGVKFKFEEGVLRTPQLTDSIVLPENVEFLGQKFNLTPFKPLLTSVHDSASSIAKSISSRFPGQSNADSWLFTTYVDEDLRISKGVSGSIFVLIKEGSSFLAA